ncbi:hypothetical protein DM02DRAFT_18348 [Periconia macrospinosa]|uniref:Uncharacterized protein n=1 Tax=Periconia macrospinosa TaxID=97972 RepID=A0A2V1DLK0_9PLEO|nr:hypothetical protein DM02DRAFT_18348 [Periconia macrospinosa]
MVLRGIDEVGLCIVGRGLEVLMVCTHYVCVHTYGRQVLCLTRYVGRQTHKSMHVCVFCLGVDSRSLHSFILARKRISMIHRSRLEDGGGGFYTVEWSICTLEVLANTCTSAPLTLLDKIAIWASAHRTHTHTHSCFGGPKSQAEQCQPHSS